jgi:glycosyltransferase involved in cell wall biosynthesis
MVSSFAPTRCGIGSFSASLAEALDMWGPQVDIFRVLQSGDVPTHDPRVVLQFDPSSKSSVARAIRVLERYDVVVFQHEFGIFGPDGGVAAVEMMEALVNPAVMAVLHTVPLHPSEVQRQILQRMAEATTSLVVPSHSARVALEDVYGIAADSVTVIPHGSRWQLLEPAVGSRRRLLTWGLLGPGKGIERAIKAIGQLPDLVAKGLTYRVVGQTHPNVVRREGYRYRDSLERLVRDLGLDDVVMLDDGFKSETELQRLVREADAVILPYDNDEQISSGVLTEAVAAGKPVIATAFPHAQELLGSGAGLVVAHDDPQDMAKAIRTILTDDLAYRRAVSQARGLSRRLSWGEVARRYVETFDRLADSLAVG